MKISQFNMLLSSKSISTLGTSFFNAAINILIVQIFGSGELLGITLAIGSFSSILFTIVGGYIGDYYNQVKLLKWIDIFSFFLCLIAIPFLENFKVSFLLVFVFLLNMNNAFTSPVIKSLIPALVTKKDIPKFNVRLSIVGEVLKIGTPLIVSFLYSINYLNIEGTLFINAMSFLFAYLFIKNIDVVVSTKKKVNIFSSYKIVLNYISNNVIFCYLIYIGFFSNIILAGFNLILPLYSKNILNNSGFYGVLLSLESIGGLLGLLSARMIKLDDNLSKERLGLLASGFLLLLPPVTKNYLSIMVVCIVLNMFLARYNVAFQNYIQKNFSSSLIGKVFAVSYTTSSIGIPIGSLVFGFMTKYQFIPIFFILSFAMIFINALWFILVKVNYK